VPKIRCREIGIADLETIIDLLTAGYQIKEDLHLGRSSVSLGRRDVWERRIKRLSDHSPPPGFPKYGFLLECNGTPVGAIFTMFSSTVENGMMKIRCYTTNWYVVPQYRSYAALLAIRALKYKNVTYLLGTPSERVWPILDGLGYVRYCGGRLIAVPALSRQVERTRVEIASSNIKADHDISSFEVELLSRHAIYGCVGLICASETGKFLFVFHLRRKGRIVPFARLVYCRDFADFIRFAGPIGRFLLRRGYPFVALDADGPIPGLVGKYSNKFPKFFKGPDRPRLGDTAYSSRIIFDF
jgi:DNA-directed RNA polymerase subunit N (RpoN/RPB10)